MEQSDSSLDIWHAISECITDCQISDNMEFFRNCSYISAPQYVGSHLHANGGCICLYLETLQVNLCKPLFSLIICTIKCIYNFRINIPHKAEGKCENKEKKEKEANAVWKPSSRLFKEIGDRLAEAKKREVFDEQGEELGKEESRLEEPVRTPCPHCGRKDHEEVMYHFHFESVQGWEKPHQGT